MSKFPNDRKYTTCQMIFYIFSYETLFLKVNQIFITLMLYPFFINLLEPSRTSQIKFNINHLLAWTLTCPCVFSFQSKKPLVFFVQAQHHPNLSLLSLLQLACLYASLSLSWVSQMCCDWFRVNQDQLLLFTYFSIAAIYVVILWHKDFPTHATAKTCLSETSLSESGSWTQFQIFTFTTTSLNLLNFGSSLLTSQYRFSSWFSHPVCLYLFSWDSGKGQNHVEPPEISLPMISNY